MRIPDQLTEPSRANEMTMNAGEKLTAIRFMLAIPVGEWMHVLSLPNYVFTYIFEVGSLEDLPWIRWQDDDTYQLIRRVRVTENPALAGAMCKSSPLFKRATGMKQEIKMLYNEQIGLDDFESRLHRYANRNSFKLKSLF